MKKFFTKISNILILSIFFLSCNSEKRLTSHQKLLYKSDIVLNGKKKNTEELTNQLYQMPNSSLLGFRLRLYINNWASPNPDSIFWKRFENNPMKYKRMSSILSAKQVNRLAESFWYKGFNNLLKKAGEAPVVFDTLKAKKSAQRLKFYHFNNGFFDVKTSYKVDSLGGKKVRVTYQVETGKPYVIDTVGAIIKSQALDSLYQKNASKSLIKAGDTYKYETFEHEKSRLSTLFRNNGIYHFQPTYISFDVDTINKKHTASVNLLIKDRSYQMLDSTVTESFKAYRLNKISIYTDFSSSKNGQKVRDSVKYKNYDLYAFDKIKYKPYSITDAVFLNKGALYSESRTELTKTYLNNLKIFKYPIIEYEINPDDPKQQTLNAKIYLSPREKYSFGFNADITHSNIQDIGIGFRFSSTIRNIFNGAETFETTIKSNLGSSKDLANPNNAFFNVLEYGADMKLSFPRILFPFSTEKIIPKRMIPSTVLTAGYSQQKNIGLDKANFVAAFAYDWRPKRNNNVRFELFNVQFVKNLNPENYFNIYQSSYNALNAFSKKYNDNPALVDENNNLKVGPETDLFMANVLSGNSSLQDTDPDFRSILNIFERKIRLTENDFIMASNIQWTKTNKREAQDKSFYQMRAKFESAGTLLSLFSKLTNKDKNPVNGKYNLFNLEYAEYAKGELEFIKHWDLLYENILAFRGFVGLAVPFGNGTYIPFSKSYFAGGTNDNRAWQPYSLGPGNTKNLLDFNEANLKIAFNLEHRFKIVDALKAAFFIDAGNIWTVKYGDGEGSFDNFRGLKNIAVGTGFGIRYDFNYFVVRFDLGFKTYNPTQEEGKRWFKDINFASSVLNFGINYPF